MGETGQACHEAICRRARAHFIPPEYLPSGRSTLDREPLIGRCIDEYLVVGHLGQGGFGDVFLTLQQPVQMKTALKLLKGLLQASPDRALLERKFENEARTLARLTHPNVVRLIKYGSFEGTPYLVMEYVERGQDLKQLLVRHAGPVSPADVRHIMTQVCRALADAHAQGVIHRDIKPENIMLQRVAGDPLFVRVLDFGLAKVLAPGSETTVVQGTPTYMAPEQFEGRDIGPWTDLYAAGLVLFELLTGQRLFAGQSSHQVLLHKLDPSFDPLAAVAGTSLPPALTAFVRRAIHPDRHQRFATAEAFSEALGEALVRLESDSPRSTASLRPSTEAADSSSLGYAETQLPAPSQVDGTSETAWAAPGAQDQTRPPLSGAGFEPTLSASSSAALDETLLAPAPARAETSPPAGRPPRRRLLRTPWLYGVLLAAMALAGTLAIALWPTPPQPLLRGTLVVETVPPGAVIRRAGEPLGETPVTLELPPGEYGLAVALDGYRTEDLSGTLKPGERERLQLLLRPVESRINAHRENRQEAPWTAALPDGRLVVTWGSEFQDRTPLSVYARFLDSAGRPQGEEFPVNQHTAQKQGYPAVAAFSDGRFVITWESLLQDGDGWGVYARIFGSDGTPATPEFQAHETLRGNQQGIRPVVLHDGRFVLAWQTDGCPDGKWDIRARIFTGQGQAAAPPFTVNETRVEDQKWVSLAAFGRGGFVVAWESRGQDGDGYGVFARCFDGMGQPAGPEFQVNQQTARWQRWPDVSAAADGRFVVVWTADGQDGDGMGVYARLFNPDRTPRTNEFRLNQHTALNQWVPSVAAFSDGRFVTVWISEGQDGAGYGVYGRVIGADGEALGDEMRIHTLPSQEKTVRSVTTLGATRFFTVWESQGEDGLDVYGRVMAVNP